MFVHPRTSASKVAGIIVSKDISLSLPLSLRVAERVCSSCRSRSVPPTKRGFLYQNSVHKENAVVVAKSDEVMMVKSGRMYVDAYRVDEGICNCRVSNVT